MSTTFNSAVAPQTRSRALTKSTYIIGPLADTVLIIGAPLLALVIAAVLFSLPDSWFDVSIRSQTLDLRRVFILAFVNGHLFVMFLRSHANQNIFRTYPLRFTVVPLAMLLLGAVSTAALMLMGLVIVWWDVYHGSMQTFGFGRIYDSKMKNDAAVGRSLDWWMNLLMVAGPVLSGANFLTHIDNTTDILQFLTTDGGTLNELFLRRTPDFLQKNQTYLAAAVLAICVPFVIYYLYSYYRLQQQGYRVSWQKVWLLIISSTVSIYIWGFHSFFDAFWVQNFFHSLQYFAIVLWAEHRNLSNLFRVSRFAYGSALAMIWVTLFCLLSGVWAGFFASGNWAMSFLVTTSIMHYWYDGFIWSVTKKQI